MATAVIMPRQGQSVESCIITEWAKKVGDTVNVTLTVEDESDLATSPLTTYLNFRNGSFNSGLVYFTKHFPPNYALSTNPTL